MIRGVIFGGTGMLGRAVTAEAHHRGHTVLPLSRAQADITDGERVLYWMEAFRPQVVINCAAFTRVDDCEERREHAFAVNARGVAHVTAAARRAGARLLHLSTDYVFDGEANTPYPEGAATAPRSAYGASKLAGEGEALAWERALVVRTSWLFGPGGPSFPATMIRFMDEGRKQLRVVDDQVGCPTYTEFLARALWDLALREEVTGVLHYRNREPVSWHGFAAEIARLWEPEVEVVPVPTSAFPRPAPRPAYSVLDVARCEELLGRRVEPWGRGLAHFLTEPQRERPESTP